MSKPLKDMFFGRAFFDDLAAACKALYPPFDSEAFLVRIFDGEWESRELKQRMRHTTIALGEGLPPDYREALAIVRKVAPALDGYGFEKVCFPDFVEVYGLGDWDASLPALEQFTQLMSAEFAVRPFILKDPERMMAQMLAWAGHESAHVRRLASEGCRPRLPWSIALPPLKANPSLILPILEQLKNDESESVRKSVANNLNDISKDNPQVVTALVRQWQADAGKEIRWIINHALRTLIKAGDPDALALLGYDPDPAVAVKSLTIEPETVQIGETLTFSFDVESLGQESQNLMIDYVLYLMRANGKQTAKVFKLKKATLGPGEVLPITKKHSFKIITTRKYYPGEHAIEIQINGALFGRAEFMVMERSGR